MIPSIFIYLFLLTRKRLMCTNILQNRKSHRVCSMIQWNILQIRFENIHSGGNKLNRGLHKSKRALKSALHKYYIGYAISYCMVETCAPIFQIHVSSLLSICNAKHKKFKLLNTICTLQYCIKVNLEWQ